MKAYHFLKADMTAGIGKEPAWTVGEERAWKGRGKPKLCKRGYHWSPSWYDALLYASGPVACIVEVSDAVEQDDTKGVSYICKLIAARNSERELRLWTCEYAERVLIQEREAGREPDSRSWRLIEAARAYTDEATTAEELATVYTARYAVCAALYAAHWGPRQAAEVAWQRNRLNEILNALFATVEITLGAQ